MSNHSHFRRGSAVYTCVSCTRRTRHTGVQSLGSELCPECHELAGIYNAYQDGQDVVALYADAIREYTSAILEKGGKLDGDAQTLLDLIAQATVAKILQPTPAPVLPDDTFTRHATLKRRLLGMISDADARRAQLAAAMAKDDTAALVALAQVGSTVEVLHGARLAQVLLGLLDSGGDREAAVDRCDAVVQGKLDSWYPSRSTCPFTNAQASEEYTALRNLRDFIRGLD